MKTSGLFYSFIISFIFLPPPALAENVELESVTVLELNASEGKAVIQYPDGKEYVLKVGDAIPWAYAIVDQVLPDMLVIEEIVEKEEYVIKQTVLIHMPESTGAGSEVERVEHNGYTRRALQLPVNDENHQ